MIPSWSPKPPNWTEHELSLFPENISKAPSTTLATIIEKSEIFPRKFPVDSGRCKTLKSLVSEEVLERNVNSVYPIVHENILFLYAQFINHKRQYGNDIEKALYKDMNLLQFIDRLLTKRPVTFTGYNDSYSLLDGQIGSFTWETIGTSKEKEPLLLKNYLSYEEIKLSAFLSVSSYTYFVNVGDRRNYGVFQKEREGIQDEGIITGIIGPRLVKENVMEYQEIIISKEQNTETNGYGKAKFPTIHHLFAKLYEEDCLDYETTIKQKKKLPKGVKRYTKLTHGEIFDNFVYYKRLLFSIDTLFMEANQRALEKSTSAYIHVVGIGLGVWKISHYQDKVFMDTCGQRIKSLGKYLHNVSDICFAYINHDWCLSYKDGDIIPIEGHPLNGIRIYINKREPHTKLTGPDEGKLLVVSWAWDANSLPGNEYWKKSLISSSDPAAAASTQIAEIQNPFINPVLCANGLRVLTNKTVTTIEEYVRNIKK